MTMQHIHALAQTQMLTAPIEISVNNITNSEQILPENSFIYIRHCEGRLCKH